MSTKELAWTILNNLTEEQLQAFVTLFGNGNSDATEEVAETWNEEMKEKIQDGINTPLSDCIPESEVEW